MRAYLKVIPRLLNRNAPTKVNISVYMRREGSSTSVHAGEMAIQVTASSAGWLELNITEGVRSLWPLHANDTNVEISVIFKSDCHKKSPVIFEDPSTISLSQTKRRKRLNLLQPIFIVHLSDEMVKQIIRNESTLSGEDYQNYNDDVSHIEGESTTGDRRRKRSLPSACNVTNFQLTFSDLHLNFVLAPHSYNARQCKGSCSHHTLNRNEGLANNHAKLLASASLLAQSKPDMFPVQPEPPCCVPTKYESMTLILPE